MNAPLEPPPDQSDPLHEPGRLPPAARRSAVAGAGSACPRADHRPDHARPDATAAAEAPDLATGAPDATAASALARTRRVVAARRQVPDCVRDRCAAVLLFRGGDFSAAQAVGRGHRIGVAGNSGGVAAASPAFGRGARRVARKYGRAGIDASATGRACTRTYGRVTGIAQVASCDERGC